MKGAAWLILSIIVIMALLFIFVIAPIMFRPPTNTEQTLADFCAQYGMDSRQRFFAGITQCYKTTVAGQATTEVACDVLKKNGAYQWKTTCSIEVPQPKFRDTTGKIP